jgi:cobaltochelatase CobT
MSHNVDVIRQSITIIAKVLSGKGIKVTQSGTNAYVESTDGVPKRINIPYIPDNASDDLILAINGFLDHEVAHVLFTDFTISKKEHFINQAIFQIYNAIEDCRIEKCMRAKFAGSRTNLDGVSTFFIEKYIQPEFVKAVDEKEMLTTLFTPAVRAWSGQDIFQDYMKDKWIHITQLQEQIADAIPKIALVRTTQDAIDLAHEIGKLLKKDKSPKTDNKEKGKQKEESEEEQGDHVDPPESFEKAEGDLNPDAEAHDAPEDISELDASENEPDEADKEPDDSEDDDSDEPNDASDDAESGESDEANPSESGESEEESDDSTDADDEIEGEGSMDEELDKSDTGMTLDLESAIESSTSDISKTLSDAIAKEVEDNLSTSEYSVYSTEYDKIERLDISRADSDKVKSIVVKLESSAREITGPLQKTLERIIKSKSLVRNLPGKRSGRINAGSLYRLKTGDDRVFRQREIGVSNDVAVSLVVDCSGSMSGQKIRIAMESAYALCEVLTRLDISNEVIGFTTLADDVMYEEHARSGETRSLHHYSRREALHLPIFKGFDERFSVLQKQRMAVGSRINNTSGLPLRNNVDGESLLLAAKRLMRMTKESTKQMIVLSDGCPCAYGNHHEIHKDLKTSIAKIEKMGINIIGIGIDDVSVRDFYKNNLVISNVSELPSLIIKELRSLLV